MKRKIANILFAVCLTASLTVGVLPTAGLGVKAAEGIPQMDGFTIRESEINQLLTEDLELPSTVNGLDGSTVTYSVGDADSRYVTVEGNKLKITRPLAGEKDYTFNLTAAVTAQDGSTGTKKFPLTIRAGLSDDSYAGYVYVCFSVAEGQGADPWAGQTADTDVQQVHFFLSEDGLNWTALNGCKPIFLTGSDYTDKLESYGGRSVEYKIKEGTDIAQTVSGDASVLFPFEGEDQGIRDPYLIRGCRKDGKDSNKIWLLATDLNTHSPKYGGNYENNELVNSTWGATATVGKGSTKLFVYETEDWVHWERRWIDVGSEVNSAMAWAPEAIYNPKKDNYLVYWSARVGTDNAARDRLYCNETDDFIHFGPTKLYEAEPYYKNYGTSGKSGNSGYGNIDTSQLWVEETNEDGAVNPFGTLYRLVKDETNNHIELMSAKTVLDPLQDYDATNPSKITPYTLGDKTYSDLTDLGTLTGDENDIKRAEIVHNWLVNNSVGNHFEKISQKYMEQYYSGHKETYNIGGKDIEVIGNYEGATMFKFIDRDEWCVMIDNYGSMKVRYEPYLTTDLSKPDSIKRAAAGTYGRTGGDIGTHGGMIPITVKEYNDMIDAYNDQAKMTGMNAAALGNYHEIPYISVDSRKLDGKVTALKAAVTSAEYSDGTKRQMNNLITQAEADVFKSMAQVDTIAARADKLLGNKLKAVPQMTAENVFLSEDSVTLYIKDGEGLKKTAALTAELDIESAPKTITWSSSNPSVASVNNGVVTAVKAGTAKITATAVGGATATCDVTVMGTPSKITLNKKKVTIKKGDTFDIEVKLPKGTVCTKFKYKPANKKIVSVSKDGEITAKKKGKTKVTVTAGNNKKAKATINVTVK